ncbi:MAG: hypothetical protein MR911_10920 [Spirochaetia bacterium]|nr:hypothetical protein [Spirochaetia bacterium]
MAENQYVNKVVYGTKEDGSENTLIDLSKDTVDSAHLLEGYSAHDKTGEQIIGQYHLKSAMVKTNDTENYTATQLSMACPYKPSAISVHYIGSGLIANQVLDLVAWNDTSGITPYYCGHSLNARNGSYYSILSTQILLSSAPDKFTWDGEKVYIKSPDSTHCFRNGTYRIMAYR